MIRKGVGDIKRRNARNFTQREADARLREVVTTYQNQGLNALGVDSFEVKFYHLCKSTQLCSCQKTEVVPSYSSKEGTVQAYTPRSPDREIVIDYGRPLFGTSDSPPPDISMEDGEDFSLDEGTPLAVDSLFSSSSDCAICFKTGSLPGYELYGFDRRLFTPFDISDTYGYFNDVSTSPHTLSRIDVRLGHVDFVLDVPKYFKGLTYAIRNNTALLVDEILLDSTGMPLTLEGVRASAGNSMIIRCTSDKFTHVVIEFDLGTERVIANLAQASRTTDWTMFDTLGSIQIVLPMTIPEVSPGDVVHVSSRNTTFKITDEQYLRTAQDRNLDWSVSARILQPTETLRSIHKTLTLR